MANTIKSNGLTTELTRYDGDAISMEFSIKDTDNRIMLRDSHKERKTVYVTNGWLTIPVKVVDMSRSNDDNYTIVWFKPID